MTADTTSKITRFGRQKLAPYKSERIEVSAEFRGYRTRTGSLVRRAFLADVRHAETDELLTDHLWVMPDDRWNQGLVIGERIYLRGRVTRYRRSDGTEDVGMTKVVRLPCLTEDL